MKRMFCGPTVIVLASLASAQRPPIIDAISMPDGRTRARDIKHVVIGLAQRRDVVVVHAQQDFRPGRFRTMKLAWVRAVSVPLVARRARAQRVAEARW